MKLARVLFAILAGTTCLAQTPVDHEESIEIGGIKQYITLRGKDQSLPLFLFLHGGPGGSVMDYSRRFTEKLEDHFVVIQWDQRETGRTLGLNTSPHPLTRALFQNDTRELIEVLLKRFQREKLYLAAHSWGTVLGFHIARNHPELLYAYLPICPMINQLESERMAITLMNQRARMKGNQKEIEELALINIPFENGTQLYYHRKWLLDLAGSRKKLSQTFVENWAATWLPVFNEASQDNLLENLPEIKCPVYFFTSRKDYQTNWSLTEAYYNRLAAPKKALFWFEFAGHAIPAAEPDLLQKLIIEKVLPETFTIQKNIPLIGQSPVEEQ